MKVTTLIIGASSKPSRYSFKAAQQLHSLNHKIYLLAKRTDEVMGYKIHPQPVPWKDIHTITMYINPQRQEEYYEYILSLKPKRIIFNPGTENPTLKKLAENIGIETVNACTLVLLTTKQY